MTATSTGAGGRQDQLHSKNPRLVTVQQAAELLGLPYGTTRDLAIGGRLQLVRIDGLRRLLIERTSIDRLIEASRVRGESR